MRVWCSAPGTVQAAAARALEKPSAIALSSSSWSSPDDREGLLGLRLLVHLARPRPRGAVAAHPPGASRPRPCRPRPTWRGPCPSWPAPAGCARPLAPSSAISRQASHWAWRRTSRSTQKLWPRPATTSSAVEYSLVGNQLARHAASKRSLLEAEGVDRAQVRRRPDPRLARPRSCSTLSASVDVGIGMARPQALGDVADALDLLLGSALRHHADRLRRLAGQVSPELVDQHIAQRLVTRLVDGRVVRELQAQAGTRCSLNSSGTRVLL